MSFIDWLTGSGSYGGEADTEKDRDQYGDCKDKNDDGTSSSQISE